MDVEEQIPLVFDRPKASKPEVADLEAFLKGKGWLERTQISAATGWDERHVRKLAAASDHVISYPGSPGYELMADCTHEEYERYRLARRSQARDMIAKVIRTDRIYYRRPAVAP